MKINIEIDLNHLEAKLLQVGDVYDGVDTGNNAYLSDVVRSLLLQRAASNVRRMTDMAMQSRRVPKLPPGPMADYKEPTYDRRTMLPKTRAAVDAAVAVMTKAKTPKV